MTFSERLGKKIQKAREKAKLTKTEAAAAAGMHYRHWHDYETGKHAPSIERFFDIAKALGVTSDSLKP